MEPQSKTCFIVNPSAKGDRARSFLQARQRWNSVGTCLETTGPGDGERLASKAILDGYNTIIAAGGDGTVLEVMNGIMHQPDLNKDIRFGVLPLGTVNVFAKELGMPQRLESCRTVLQQAKTKKIDVPFAVINGAKKDRYQRYFAQLGGAGLDAFAIQAVNWDLKKRLGPFAYVWAGLKVIFQNLPLIQCRSDEGVSANGSMVLIGNGSYYGGRFRVFPKASLDDGLLHVLVFHHLSWTKLPGLGLALWMDRLHQRSDVTYLKSVGFDLKGANPTPFELEGDVVGSLPVRIEVSGKKLQVIVP